MQKKLLYPLMLLLGYVSYGQFACPTLNGPKDGDIDVPVDAVITWNAIDGVPSYLISIGTTPKGRDIIDRRSVGGTSYSPPLGLPENMEIYVTITLFFFNSDNIECSSEQFRTEDVVDPPLCTNLLFPMDQAIDVNVGTPITWNYAPKATGYRLNMGTAPGEADILDNFQINGSPSYESPTDLPFETEIFVSIVPFNENGEATEVCQEFSFITEAQAFIPDCTMLTTPKDGAINVPLSPLLEWPPIAEAIGYRLSIGTSPTENNILDNGVYSNNSTSVIEFLPARTIFITIVPFNQAGNAIGCTQTSFTTILGCGPLLDEDTGEIVSFGPEIDFPDQVAICQGENPTLIASEDHADGYRWFKLNDDGSEILLSETVEVALREEGRYRYEAYNLVSQTGIEIECANSKDFMATVSEIATILSLDVSDNDDFRKIMVQVEGIGDYEYALDTVEGPYQANASFENAPLKTHTVFVRDKNGCGIAEKSIIPDLTLEGFPKFFTPNGDGINDFWQFIPPNETGNINVNYIYIFDRYGILITRIAPNEQGWDGRLNGESLPSSDYWFRATGSDNQEIKGHFLLKR